MSSDVGANVSEAAGRISRTCALADDVGRLRYVSGKRAEAMERLGIARVSDLLLHIPRRYLDLSHTTEIGLVSVGEHATVMGTVDKVRIKRPRPHLQIVELSVIDDTGVVMVSFFRQPWIADQVHEGDTIVLSGKVGFSYGFRQMNSPFYEVVEQSDSASSSGHILPVYSVGEGVSVAWMRRIVAAALGDIGDVADFLPASLVASRRLMSRARAVREIHFPSSLESAEFARRRLAYDELLCLQIALLCRQRIRLAGAKPTSHVVDGAHLAALMAAMPFELTSEQHACANDILRDMGSARLMNRLLLGDVGTGKTAVAAVGLAAVADTGTQAAMMAPTSVLAMQYAEKLGPLLDAAGVRWALIVGSTPADVRARAAKEIASGEISVVFGTTAILSDDICFRHLSLVVIDEQHRFGVEQRAGLRRKGRGADMLMMSATPIPRTLALSIYGDLSCSRIAHRPVAGAGVSTCIDTPENLDRAYDAIRAAVAEGHQAYVVCPLIDDADDAGEDLIEDGPKAAEDAPRAHSATATYADLSGRIFKDMRVGLLTGRMRPAEKDDIMARFRAHEIDVLVSTTVIEVGVDVPNATAMLIFDADRFGLATLHQLRGRVGRGKNPGVVHLATTAKKGTPARQRLAALEATPDGQELAELDLALRHEGEVLGYRQHGGVTLYITDLEADKDLVEWAHADAIEIADADPKLEQACHRMMALEVEDRFEAYFEEERA